jgi:hypothetical protein
MESLKGIFLATLAVAASFAAAAGIEDSYFVQDGPTMFKAVLSNGSSYRFEYDASSPGRLVSAVGWTGQYDRDGRTLLKSPTGEFLEFDRGRLVACKLGGEERKFAYDVPRSAPANTVTPLAILLYDEKTLAEDYIQKEESIKWTDTGRLAFPYVNPNFTGALFAQIALFLLAVAIGFVRRRTLCVSCLVGAAVSSALVVWSGSRGALIGLLAGAGLALAFTVLRRGLSRRVVVGAGVAAVVVVALVLALGHENLMRGFGGDGGLDWSNALRVEMMKAAPRMMADAPGGWSPFGIGKAFTYWYQPLGMVLMSGSLINAHLTWLAGYGTVGRFVYLFLLFAALALSFRLALREKAVVPLAVLGGFATMACFNPLFGEWGMWVVPAVASVPLFLSLRRQGGKALLLVCGGCVLSALLALCAIQAVGSSSHAGQRIRFDGRRVTVNGDRPRIWVVDDGQGVIGGVLVGRDIREHYARSGSRQPIGYVRDVKDLPRSGVERLVLPGKAGNDWLLMLSEDERARESVPRSVLFLNPPFSPSEMPQAVLALCHPALVVGEFAARYNPEYRSPPAWVTIVPGVEKYMAGWMSYALGE